MEFVSTLELYVFTYRWVESSGGSQLSNDICDDMYFRSKIGAENRTSHVISVLSSVCVMVCSMSWYALTD